MRRELHLFETLHDAKYVVDFINKNEGGVYYSYEVLGGLIFLVADDLTKKYLEDIIIVEF